MMCIAIINHHIDGQFSLKELRIIFIDLRNYERSWEVFCNKYGLADLVISSVNFRIID